MPSPKDIQKKLDKPLAKLELPPALANKPKELANAAKLNTPNADNVASKVNSLPQPDPNPQSVARGGACAHMYACMLVLCQISTCLPSTMLWTRQQQS